VHDGFLQYAATNLPVEVTQDGCRFVVFVYRVICNMS